MGDLLFQITLHFKDCAVGLNLFSTKAVLQLLTVDAAVRKKNKAAT